MSHEALPCNGFVAHWRRGHHPDPLPASLADAHAMIRAERAARLAAEARAGDLEIARAALEVARLEVTRSTPPVMPWSWRSNGSSCRSPSCAVSTSAPPRSAVPALTS